MDRNAALEDAIFTHLEAKRAIKVKWNLGGDDGTILIILNDEELDYQNPFGQELELYLMNLLHLDGTGDFELEGGGELIIENNEIFIVYKSIIKGYGAEDGWKEVNEVDDYYTGKKKLFDEFMG